MTTPTRTIHIHGPEGLVEATPHAVDGIWAAHPGYLGEGMFASRGHHVLTHLPTGHRALILSRKDWSISVCRFMGRAFPPGSIADTESPETAVFAEVEACLHEWGEEAGVAVDWTPWGFEANYALETTNA